MPRNPNILQDCGAIRMVSYKVERREIHVLAQWIDYALETRQNMRMERCAAESDYFAGLRKHRVRSNP